MNVFWHELRMLRLAGLWWLIGLALLALMFVSLYPSFTHDVDTSRKLLEGFPSQLRAAVGISIQSFFTFFGFYSYTLTYITVAAATYGAILGLSIYSKEDRNKTTDFLFAKPISRTSVFLNKLFAIAIMVVVVGGLLGVLTYVSARLFNAGNISIETFVLFSFSVIFIQLWFMALGVVISILIPKIKSVISVALAVVVGFLIIGMISAVVGDANLRYLTPFKYFDYQYIMAHQAYEPRYLGIGCIVITICLLVSYAVYTHRDTRAAS